MTVYAITDTKKGRTGIAPTYLQTTHHLGTEPDTQIHSAWAVPLWVGALCIQ